MQLLHWLRRKSSDKWSGWPEKVYQTQRYQQRLAAVQNHLAACLDAAPRGPLRVVSICAGDGRDVTGVVSAHRRGRDVSAWLVESDGCSVAAGVERAAEAGLTESVRFVHADATLLETYASIIPADIVLVCGVWGHVPVRERTSFVRALASFCKPRGAVVWTRGVKRGMERFREIQSLFDRPRWKGVRTSTAGNNGWAVATHRYFGPPAEAPASGRIFNFQANAGNHVAQRPSSIRAASLGAAIVYLGAATANLATEFVELGAAIG